MIVSIIAAIADNGAIGKGNDLIWYLSEDLKRFKKLTTNHTIIMGRKTFESFPIQPLPNRKNVIITRQKEYSFKGCKVVHSTEEALEVCKTDGEIFICGGAEIYTQFMNKADKMYLTHLHQDFDADTFFPEFEKGNWEIVNKSEIKTDKKNGIRFSFIDYVLKQSL